VSRERLEAMLPGVPAMDPVDVAASCDVLLLAVPDDELGPLVAGLAKLQAFAPGQLVVHVAGRFGVGVLDPAAQLGAMPLALHPAMTFTGTSLDVARLAGCPFAVTAANTLLPIGQALAAEVGGHPVVVAEEDRGLYHAALSHAANHLVTLVGQSMRALEAVGVDDPGSYLAPLLQASLDGALSSGEAAPPRPPPPPPPGGATPVRCANTSPPSTRSPPPGITRTSRPPIERSPGRRRPGSPPAA
jgi:chalcone/stilbene synthase family protein